MTEAERERNIANLDETLFQAMSVEFSAWAHFLILDSDLAFVKGAYLAALVTAICAIETQLRFDHTNLGEHLSFAELIDIGPLPPDEKAELQELRKFRNKWVHVSDPWDESLIEHVTTPDGINQDLEPWALRAVTGTSKGFLLERNVELYDWLDTALCKMPLSFQ
jgi:hypothetical protein